MATVSLNTIPFSIEKNIGPCGGGGGGEEEEEEEEPHLSSPPLLCFIFIFERSQAGPALSVPFTVLSAGQLEQSSDTKTQPAII